MVDGTAASEVEGLPATKVANLLRWKGGHYHDAGGEATSLWRSLKRRLYDLETTGYHRWSVGDEITSDET